MQAVAASTTLRMLDEEHTLDLSVNETLNGRCCVTSSWTVSTYLLEEIATLCTETLAQKEARPSKQHASVTKYLRCVIQEYFTVWYGDQECHCYNILRSCCCNILH